MQVLVTGASAPLGQALLRLLAARGVLASAAGPTTPVRRIIAVDRSQAAALFTHPLVEYVCGNFEQSRYLAHVMGVRTDSVFHLSSLDATVFGAPEDDAPMVSDPEPSPGPERAPQALSAAAYAASLDGLEAALLLSLDTTRALLDACRHQRALVRLVYASTQRPRPADFLEARNTQEVLTALCELFLSECGRRGLIDLRCVRLPPPPGSTARQQSPERAAAALLRAHDLPRCGPAQLSELAAAP